jgi:hypothetical protein
VRSELLRCPVVEHIPDFVKLDAEHVSGLVKVVLEKRLDAYADVDSTEVAVT